MSKKTKKFELDEPMRHLDHRRPVTRREFVSQGFAFGTGAAVGGSLLGMMSSGAHAQLSDYISDEIDRYSCNAFDSADAKIPFICFDLAGGANIAGSNVLIGGPGGQEDFLSASGYAKQGLPADRIPSVADANNQPQFDTSMGLAFHTDSMFFNGIMEKVSPEVVTNTNGAVFAARSENDTGNNPHNPMYAINRVGANGELLALIGSRASDSGGNSLAPMAYMNPEVRPTKVDRASDVTGLVDTGDLANLLGKADTNAVMEAIYRLSNAKLGRVNTGLSSLPTTDAVAKELVRCGYLNSARIADTFRDPIDPGEDEDIVDPTTTPAGGIFTREDYEDDREFRKTAAIMKMVVNGYAGAGTITMGGYDYHGGGRITGDNRDLRAGRCIGACLEYARRKQKPLMIYVFSDGSLSSNGMIDNNPRIVDPNTGFILDAGGNGKFMWTSDNQQTAGSFFLLYDPVAKPTAVRNQIGFMRPSGDVETSSWPGANNVNLLVQAIALNYMAVHGMKEDFANTNYFPNQGLGTLDDWNNYIAFDGIPSITSS